MSSGVGLIRSIIHGRGFLGQGYDGIAYVLFVVEGGDGGLLICEMHAL